MQRSLIYAPGRMSENTARSTVYQEFMQVENFPVITVPGIVYFVLHYNVKLMLILKSN